MLERDLQDYLFENPDVLFPGKIITRKRREVYIEGRRIDLLFEVDGVQHIVELKRDTIKREDIGQVFEYYGLMRQSNETASFKMILVAPSIPAYRRIPLEEFGIRCVEVQHRPQSLQERALLISAGIAYQKREHTVSTLVAALPSVNRVRFEDLLPPIHPKSLKLSHLLLRDGLASVQKAFSEYEVVLPIKMANSNQPDVLCFPDEGVASRFVRGGAWWAFSFGQSEEMPKNDVPNISVNALPWGLDFAVNAELRTSQEVMRQRVERSSERFDALVLEHGDLQLQAWLKLEHQPRFYHWIPLSVMSPNMWRSHDLLELYRRSELNYSELRSHWLAWIAEQRATLTVAQLGQMNRTNRKLNLAIRLVRSFGASDPLWNQPYGEQQAQFQAEYRKLKPLIDFFQ
jgi:hypothetical protein